MPFQIAKLDDDECLVFGFANVSISKSTATGAGGEEFFDLQEDSIPPKELEIAAYEYVHKSGEVDEMHKGGSVGYLVESILFTPEKLERFATDPATGEVSQGDLMVLKRLFPCRWWVGYKLDKASYARVKSGEFKMFSIAGKAEREEL